MLAAIFRILVGTLLLALAPAVAGAEAGRGPDPVFRVELPDSLKDGPQDGRLLLIFAPADHSPEQEPRELVNWDGSAIPFYGLDVEGWAPGTSMIAPSVSLSAGCVTCRRASTGCRLS